MIVEKTAAKKTLAVALALALGLGVPGVSWAQVISGRAVTPGVSASGASVTGALGANNLRFEMTIPTLSIQSAAQLPTTPSVILSPAAITPESAAAAQASAVNPSATTPAGVTRHPVIGLIENLQKAGIVLPESLSTRADAQKLEAAAQAMPEGAAGREQLLQLAAMIKTSNGDGGKSLNAAFDGSANAAPNESGAVSSRWGGLFDGVRSMLNGGKSSKPVPQPEHPGKFEVKASEARFTPAAENLPESTAKMPLEDMKIVGQSEGMKAMKFGLKMPGRHYNMFLSGPEGSGRETALRSLLSEIAPKMPTPGDIVAATNFKNPDSPVILSVEKGKGAALTVGLKSFVKSMQQTLVQDLSAGNAAKAKKALIDQVQAAHDKRQADFEAEVAAVKLGDKFGVYFDQAVDEQTGQTNIAIGLTVAGDKLPTQISEEEIASRVEAGQFTRAEFEAAKKLFQKKAQALLEVYQTIMQTTMSEMEALQTKVAMIDAKAAASIAGRLGEALIETVAPRTPRTPEDEAFEKRVAERMAEIKDALAKIKVGKDGKFSVSLVMVRTPQGPAMMAMPTYDGKPLVQEAVQALLESGAFTPAELKAAVAEVTKKAQPVLAKLNEYQKINVEEGEALEKSKPEVALTPETIRAVGYLKGLVQYAAQNYEIFMPHDVADGLPEGIKPMPGARASDPMEHFRMSVLVNNAALEGAPVVWEENATYERLFGMADGNARNMILSGVGIIKTDGPGGPTLKGGSYHKANGGFLVLRAMDVLRQPGVWPALMQAVRTGAAEIAEGGLMGMASMKGELYPVASKVKIVLIGSPSIRMLLAQHDEDFALNFQSVADFQPTVDITEDSVKGFVSFLKQAVVGSAGQIMDLTKDAIGRVLEHAARMADSNSKFTAQFGALYGVLREASYWANEAGRAEIRAEDVEAALKAKQDREEVYQKHMLDLYKKNIFTVYTEGAAAGQINGLAVMGSFGVPMRVTFVVGAGAPGIVSVDQDAKSTGRSFDKALGNVHSFFMKEFGQTKTMRAQIRVSYEQNYGGIDGDSATSTEIYGILSSLSGVPIGQNFAVTGSADQFGNVQAIGGVNEKIEGFFALCKHRGLTGTQGVVIPRTNVGDLQLSPEVVKAIKDGQFHVYAVEHVSQGIEILTGTAYSVIKEKAEKRLAQIAKAK